MKSIKVLYLIIISTYSSFLASSEKLSEITWSEKISVEMLPYSYSTWNDHYSDVKKISYEDFSKAAANGTYAILTIQEFLDLNIENHRLQQYINAKTAEDAYPENDRPRGNKDIDSVNYHLTTNNPISPICIARTTPPNKIRLIKLDGVHRLIAASIRKSHIKVLFIDL